ncbi:wall-associated receptor kinase-like 5 isoform X2 [Ziziphus jujuba]|uniref:Wall-associated receptor kinase-like 5 isoform X2 n=1 Tax=Ziziphus jujuba TaxID=326968 RepID=A0ABM3IH75_ZIZJJ|nr:wall-associated receptor kinase-like 5 isoform X2 [Ziziphus jujuba]
MVRRLLLVCTIVFLWLIIHDSLASAVPAATIGKHGCQTECGNVNISFPFGIGSPHCYADDWFEVVCKNSSRPFLKRTNLEVLNTSYIDGYLETDQTIQVRSPITFWNCKGKGTQGPLNLTGSPFVLSNDQNIVAAISYDVLALMSSSILDGTEISAGCKSKCSNKYHNRSCNGVNCCQTTIPSHDMQTYTITFQNTDSVCKYAFVVDENWFMSSNSTDFVEIKDMHFVPVTLYWTLYHSPQEIFGNEFMPENSGSKYYCQNGAVSGNQTSFRCFCKDGYSGIAYLSPDGCQDVNECEMSPTICDGVGTCVNTVGSYKCRKPKVLVVVIGFGSGLGALFLLIGTWRSYKFIKKRKAIRRRKRFFKRNGGLVLQQQLSSGEI